MKYFCPTLLLSLLVYFFSGIPILAQNNPEKDGLNQALIPRAIKQNNFMKHVEITADMRMGWRTHFENGGNHHFDESSDFSEFRNESFAIGVTAKITDQLEFHFRDRFTKSSQFQSLDKLQNEIEYAYIDLKLNPKLNLQLGKMAAYFGGFEYEFNPIEVLEYNDIQNNLLNYVTGAGITYQATPKHSFGFQALNSRTESFKDLFGEHNDEGFREPNFPFEFVGNWRGSFFGGKFQTIYSYSYGLQVRGEGTNFITLGNKYENGPLKIMYDFNYSHEDVDTKGVATNIVNDGLDWSRCYLYRKLAPSRISDLSKNKCPNDPDDQ